MPTPAPGFDVAIIGAGIAGSSLAYRLAPQVRVMLIEAEEQPGHHSTGRSAAMFMESYGSPQGRALTRASRAFYESPPAGFTDSPLVRPRGVLYVGWDEQGKLLAAELARLRQDGSRVERLTPAEALAQLPVLRPQGLLGAIAEPDAQEMDAHALLQGFVRGARRQGATFRPGAALAALEREAGGWRLALADGTELRAAVVVDAAGAWADTVAALAGLAPLGIEPRRRSAFTFAPPEGIDHRGWPLVAAVDESWYLKPDAGQLLGSPANADPVAPHDVQAEELDVALGIAGIEAGTSLRIRRPTRTWAGLRSFSPDGEMVIGEDPRAPGFWWLAGQGGWGLQSAAGASALAAARLLRQDLPEPLLRAGVDARALEPGRLLGDAHGGG
jgi:D-arginine dehydrogenase